MKKNLSHLSSLSQLSGFFLVILIILSPKPAYAQEEEMVVATAEITPTVNIIPSLTLDPLQNGPAEKIVPLPTPKPQKESLAINIEEYQDKRSWTRFKYKELIFKVAKQYSLDPQIIYATIMTESEGDEYAYRYEPYINDASLCMGQILISTARNLGFDGDPSDLYKPNICIDLIGKYYRNILDTFGDLTPLQLATAYNAGSPWKWPVPGHLFRFDSWYNEETGG